MQIGKVQRVKLATVAILALVLAAGFLLGAAWDRRLDAQPMANAEGRDAQQRQRNERRAPTYTRVQPALTPEQVAAADVILEHRKVAARALMKESRIDSLYLAMKASERAFRDVYDPRFAALADSSRSAIKQVMTPAQAAQYDSLLARDRRRGGDGNQGSR